MGRPKSFPETIYAGMDKQNKIVILTKQVAEALEQIGIKTAKYRIGVLSDLVAIPGKPVSKRKTQKKTEKTLGTDTAQGKKTPAKHRSAKEKPPQATQDAGNDTSEVDQLKGNNNEL